MRLTFADDDGWSTFGGFIYAKRSAYATHRKMPASELHEHCVGEILFHLKSGVNYRCPLCEASAYAKHPISLPLGAGHGTKEEA